MSELKNILARNLRIARNNSGMSQEDLAAATNIDRTYVSGIERSKRNPSIEILEKFAAALNTTPAALLTENGIQTD